MSVNSYRKGCHLLNHDDVIDTRRVSYILYMPMSGRGRGEHEWKPEWGGALELYDVTETAGIKEPLSYPLVTIPPRWNQFVFFEVQPGHSFHSVEEVLVGDEESRDYRQRLSISGWFHEPQEGEEGYVAKSSEELSAVPRSSLQQLSSSQEIAFGVYDTPQELISMMDLTTEEVTFLSEYMNPAFLKTENIKKLSEHFALESQVSLQDFLKRSVASALRDGITTEDSTDGFRPEGDTRISPHSSGQDKHWKAFGPPHKSRYCVLTPEGENSVPISSNSHTSTLRDLQDKLLPSSAFRAWLSLATTLIPRRHHVRARRFRPGLDYTLASSTEDEARLDVVLSLTPTEGGENSWGSGGWGGWECYMAPDDGDEDPAVYRSAAHAKNARKTQDVDTESAQEEDGTLLTQMPAFNSLLIVLRDARVLHFVKYLSAEAKGCRWDICGEYEVDMLEEDDADDADEVDALEEESD